MYNFIKKPLAVAFPVKVAGKHSGDWMRVPVDHDLPIQDCELFYAYNSEDHFVPLCKFKYMQL